VDEQNIMAEPHKVPGTPHALKLSDGMAPDNMVYVSTMAFHIQFSKCQINCAA
jgi:hypothetical protein